MPKNLTSFETTYLGQNSDEFDKMEEYSNAQKMVAFFLNLSELCIQLIILPVCVLFMRIVFATTVIHRNLRFILLCQSAIILWYACIRSFFVAPIKIYTGDLFWTESEFRFPPAEYILDLPIFFRISLGHLIILERVIATLMAKNYERNNGNWFSIGWLACLLLITLLNLLYEEKQEAEENLQEEPKTTLIAFIFALMLAIVSFVETVLLIMLWYYNKSKFSQVFSSSGQPRKNSDYELTKRYQYLENMRTTIQLVPTLIVCFMIQLISAFLSTFHFYTFIPDDFADEIINQCANLALAIFNLLILLTPIIFHPILRLNLSIMLRMSVCCLSARVSPTNISVISLRQSKSSIEETERHFKLLKNIWEKPL